MLHTRELGKVWDADPRSKPGQQEGIPSVILVSYCECSPFTEICFVLQIQLTCKTCIFIWDRWNISIHTSPHTHTQFKLIVSGNSTFPIPFINFRISILFYYHSSYSVPFVNINNSCPTNDCDQNFFLHISKNLY